MFNKEKMVVEKVMFKVGYHVINAQGIELGNSMDFTSQREAEEELKHLKWIVNVKDAKKLTVGHEILICNDPAEIQKIVMENEKVLVENW